MRTRLTQRKVFERYLTEADERKLFRHLQRINCPYARRDLAWMRLLRHTGIRVGTLIRLTVADARQAIATQCLAIDDEDAKGGRGYDVTLFKPALHALQTLLAVRRGLGRNMYPDSPLVTNRQGGHVSDRLLQMRMRMWCRAAGLSVEATPHWLRHTHAKRIMKNSTSQDPHMRQRICQLRLGHTDPRSTEIYTLPDREDIELALREAS